MKKLDVGYVQKVNNCTYVKYFFTVLGMPSDNGQ